MHPLASHRARVTDIGEYIRHRSCQRRFRLADDGRALYRTLPFADRPYHLIDPVLVEAGRQREDAWADALRLAGLLDLGLPEGEPSPWPDLRAALATVAPGTPAFAREVALDGPLGAFHLHGQIDFLLLRWQDGRPCLRLVECKASRRDRTYHRVQLALYRGLLAASLAVEPLEIAGHRLGPDALEAVVVRIDEATGQSHSILDAAPFPELAAITHDLAELLAPGGTLDRVLATPLGDLPFQLDDKCDDCAFSAHCFAESARQRRLELLGIAPACARALRRAGVADLHALADLDRQAPVARTLAADPDLGESLEVLQVLARTRRATLPDGRADHPIQPRPFAGRGHLPAHEQPGGARLLRIYLSISYDYVDNRVGALAAHVTRSDGELVTPFARTSDGRLAPIAGVAEELVRYRDPREAAEDPAAPASPFRQLLGARDLQGADLVRFQTVPWTGIYERDNGLELQLLQGFLRELVDAIADVADAPAAPIHFYVWSRAEMRRLLEAASRVGSGLLGHLRQLLGCRESLEQLIFSCLQDEIVSRYALGWTGRGLTVATSLSWYGQRFHWRRAVGRRREEVELAQVFYRDVFDFRDRLAFHAADPERRWATDAERGQPGVIEHRFEVRARSFDNLSAPYWRAYWGTLPTAESLRGRQAGLGEALRDYGNARRPGVLDAYLLARAHCLRWLDERIRHKNRSIDKPPIALDTLPTFELGTRHLGDAAVDFLRLDHHVKAQDWLRAHLGPPVLRVSAGISLPIADLTLDGEGKRILARVDPTLDPGGLPALRARFPKGEGDFVRITPRPADPAEGPSYFDLIYRAKTATIRRLDWERGEVELALIPSFDRGGERDPFILPSYPFRPADPDPRDHPFPLATLDESLSDFIAGRVERRLRSAPKAPMKGRHVLAWFDPESPQIPTEAPLPPPEATALHAFLTALRFGPNLDHRLDDERIAAILGGLGARIQLLQGPPGTGKTTTTSLALLTRILARRRVGDVILVAAHTHTAIDTLLARLLGQGADFMRQAAAHGLTMPRVGARKLISAAADEADDPAPGQVPTLAATGTVREFQDLRKKGVVILGGTVGTLLKFVDQTLNKSADFKKLPDGFQTPLLVVDEASMMVFPHFLALASLVHTAGAILVAGDHRQLAPIVAHDWESEDRPPTVLYKPYVSAYEAIWNLRAHPRAAPAIRVDQLTHTHRLPPILRALIQPLYSRDGIHLSGPDEGDLPPVALDSDTGTSGAPATSDPLLADVVAIDPAADPWRALWRSPHRLILAVHDEAASDHQNPVEAAILEAILAAAPPLLPRSVAVVTPHRAQRALLRERLAAHADAVDLIDTVERLQGGERPIILFSATESDPLAIAQRVEFILDLNRSNVAFSRTQQRLVVVCARTLLDYVPPEVDDYASALLWKHLRHLCDHELARTTALGIPVTLRVPSDPTSAPKDLA